MKMMLACLSVLAVAVSVFAADPIVWNKKNKFNGWGSQFRCKKTLTEGGMTLTVTGADCNICNNNVKINPKEYNQLLIEYRSKDVPAQNDGKLYYATEKKGFNEGCIWRFGGLKNDGEWHILTLFNDSKKWQDAGMITQLRLDIIEQDSGTIEIRSITFTNSEEE